MSKPESMKADPWTSFPEESYNSLMDDFISLNAFTIKISQTPFRGKVNLKQKIERKQDKESGRNLKGSGEIKLWFPLKNEYRGQIYFCSKSDTIKLHYDNGKIQWKNFGFNYANLYGTIQSNKKFQNPILKFGGKLFANSWSFDNRLRLSFAGCCNVDNVSLGSKFSWSKNNWFIDCYKVFSFKDLSLISNAIRVGYKFPKDEIFIQAYNQSKRSMRQLDWFSVNSYFSEFYLDYVHKIDKDKKVVLQGKLTAKTWRPKLSFGFISRIKALSDIELKGKISTDKKLTLNAVKQFGDNKKIKIGLQLANVQNKVRSAFGIQFQANL